MRRPRVGVIGTHPVQYQAPLYRRLAEQHSIDLTVYYAHRPTPDQQGEGFGVPFSWDVDLTSGYDHQFLKNDAAHRGTGYRGYDTPEIGNIVRSERFDAFVVNGWHARTYWQAIRACWATRTPVLVRGDSQLYDDRNAFKRSVKWVGYRAFVPRFAACLAVGERSEQYFRHYGARRVFRVPHFVDNGFFARARTTLNSAAVRAQWKIDPGAFVVLLAGKLIPRKRPLDLIDAAAALGEPVHVLLAGEGELRDQVGERARQTGVPLTITGFLNQSRIPEAYAAADVLVLPSQQDTWGLVVNEAMASALPAVVSDACGCAPDLIVEGKTGYTFRTGDVKALREAVGRVYQARRRGEDLGAIAHRHIQSWTVDTAATGFVEAVECVAGQRAPDAGMAPQAAHGGIRS